MSDLNNFIQMLQSYPQDKTPPKLWTDSLYRLAIEAEEEVERLRNVPASHVTKEMVMEWIEHNVCWQSMIEPDEFIEEVANITECEWLLKPRSGQ